MQKILLVLVCAFSLVSLQAQVPEAKGWKELTAFHAILAATYHPTEQGNFAPLKERVNELYAAAKNLLGSPIPTDYKAEKTKEEMGKLFNKVFDTQVAVQDKATDAKLAELIEAVHDSYHKIAGECKKDD